jgi:hypothetical protein
VIRKQLIALLLTCIAAPAGAWWDCAWDYRFPVVVNKGSGATLTNYQVRLNLTAANVPAQFSWNANGNDLRVLAQNDVTVISHFIERWDAVGRTATVWLRMPSIPSGNTTVFVYFGAPPGTTSTSSVATFTETGLKIHTKNSAVDPVNRATAEAAFASASSSTGGYGCTIINSYTGITNIGLFGPPNRNDDFGLYAEVFFTVTPAQAGLWRFRYGADFGRGGGLYIDDVAIDEKWNSDLWWANDWNNTTQILQCR